MGAAFVTRRGIGGSNRLEKMTSTGGLNGGLAWKNLAVSTNIYFLQAEVVNTDNWERFGSIDAFVENGEIEVLSGDISDFGIVIDATSITIYTPYSNAQLDGSHTNLYRFC